MTPKQSLALAMALIGSAAIVAGATSATNSARVAEKDAVAAPYSTMMETQFVPDAVD